MSSRVGRNFRFAAAGNALSEAVFAKAEAEGANAVVVSAAIEADLVTMEMDERLVFLEEMGLHETGLARVIRSGYDLIFAGAWWVTVLPGLVLIAVLISVNVLGDALRDALDPRFRRG